MKLIKTDFNMKVNAASSWIVYLCNSHEDAQTIHNICLTQRAMHTAGDWYYHISTNKVLEDCRVPSFFHNREYWVTVVEHNNGDWKHEQTYELYIVE